jgi:hypothetical protein
MFRFKKRASARREVQRPRWRLWLESLEDRSLPSVTPGTGFAGINFQNSDCNCVPPDTIMGVGPNNIVELANSAVNIYTKTGTLISAQSFQQFFAPVFSGSNADLFDPQVFYDDIAGRFVVGVDQQNSTSRTSNYLFAVSNTSDATQGFTEMHEFNLKEGTRSRATWGDFPHMGYNADTYTLTANQFTFRSGSFQNVQMVTIAKSSVLDANNSTFTSFHTDLTGSTNFTLIPAHQHGAVSGDPVWAVEENGFQNGSSIRVDKITNANSSSPTITGTNLTVASYGAVPSAPSAGGVSMQANDTRILSVALRGGRLIVTHTVGLNSTATVRWYEFNVSGATPSLTQSGNIAPGAGIATYFPSVDINTAGTIGMTYMESSATETVSMYVTGQVAGSTPGSMQPGVVAQAGQAKYTAFDSSPHRAGDYSGMAVDPSDGTTFWGGNEYATNAISNNWGTHIRAFTVAGLSSPVGIGSVAATQSGGSNATIGSIVPDNRNKPIFERDAPLLFAGVSDHGNSGNAPGQAVAAPAATLNAPSVDAYYSSLALQEFPNLF